MRPCDMCHRVTHTALCDDCWWLSRTLILRRCLNKINRREWAA